MLTDAQFESIAAAAHKAASPDNMQAWRFVRTEAGMDLVLPTEGRLPTDVSDMFSKIGIGCALENALIEAGSHGLVATPEVLDDETSAHGDVLVRLRFSDGGAADPLAAQFDKRCTNRKPYVAEPLDADLAAALVEAVEHTGAQLDLLTSDQQRTEVGALIADNDWIRMSHQPLHAELFDVFRLSGSAAARGDGLDLASLELPSFAGLFLWLVGFWPVAQVLNAIGLAKGFAKGSGDAAIASGGVGLITVDSPDVAGYLAAGRALQRAWLVAAAHDLAMQPIGGLAQYFTKVEHEPETFGPGQADHLRGLRPTFDALFPAAQGRTLGILFRVGRATNPPLGRSRRRPLESVVVS